jgi:hypothetical protein
MAKINRNRVLALGLCVWLVLWLLFLVREDKKGQYAQLYELYSLRSPERMRQVVGPELYDFLMYCRSSLPEGATYELVGFEKYSIDGVRARYLLWPLRSGPGDADYRIVYSAAGELDMPGYSLYTRLGRNGRVFKREGAGP